MIFIHNNAVNSYRQKSHIKIKISEILINIIILLKLTC